MNNKKIELKGFSSGIIKSEDDIYSLTVVGSKEIIDRDNEVLKVEGINLKNYKKNPVVLWAHSYNGLPIGKAKKVWVEDKKLMFKIEFAKEYAFANTIAKLYDNNYLNAFSIGFLPDWEKIEYVEGKNKKKHRVFKEAELLEISAVPVPANPLALSTEKSFEMIINKECEEGNVEGDELTYLEGVVKEANKSIKKEQGTENDSGEQISAPEIDYGKEIEDLKEEINSLKKDDYLFSLFDTYKKEVNEKEDMAKHWINVIKNQKLVIG